MICQPIRHPPVSGVRFTIKTVLYKHIFFEAAIRDSDTKTSIHVYFYCQQRPIHFLRPDHYAESESIHPLFTRVSPLSPLGQSKKLLMKFFMSVLMYPAHSENRERPADNWLDLFVCAANVSRPSTVS